MPVYEGEDTEAISEYMDSGPNLTKGSISKGMPERQVVEDDQTSWDVDLPEYDPPYYISDSTRKAYEDGLYGTDPEDIDEVERDLSDFDQDEDGYPLHPLGRTGIKGLGKLWQYGGRDTGDGVVFKRGETEPKLLVIRKDDDGDRPKLPGGFMDPEDDNAYHTALREVAEETGLNLDRPDVDQGLLIARIPTQSSRSTDNAWIDTTGTVWEVHGEAASQILAPEDDADDALWVPLSREIVEPMSPHHKVLVKAGMEMTGIEFIDE